MRRWPSACSSRRWTWLTPGRGRCSCILRDAAASLPILVAPQDQLDALLATSHPEGVAPNRTQLMYMLRGRTAISIPPPVLSGLARIDGAAVMDTSGTDARDRRHFAAW